MIDGSGTFFDKPEQQLLGSRGIGAEDRVDCFDPYPTGKRCLDIGYGTCRLLDVLKKNGNSVFGVDIGKEAMRVAVENNQIDDRTLIYLDVSHNKLPWIDNVFDYVYCTETIEHLENPAFVFMEIKRVLKPNGRFVVAFPRPEDNFGYDGGKHAHMYPGFLLKYSFRYFLKQMYFKILKYWENGSSAWYLLENIKEGDEVGVHLMIQGNYNEDELYKKLNENAWDEKNDPHYESKTLDKFKLKIMD